jgi:hypothetical protein
MSNKIVLLVSALVFLVACSSKNVSREKEIKALQLLGNAGGGAVTSSCNLESTIINEPVKIFQEYLVDKNIAENLFTTAQKIKQATRNCAESGASFSVSKNPKIAQIKEILGKEESTETGHADGAMGSAPIILYKFGWLSFGVANSNVILLKVDFKSSGP